MLVLVVCMTLTWRSITKGGDSRRWTTKDGQQFQGAIVSSDSVNVKYQLADGRYLTLPIASLSTDDQKLITK